MASETPMRRRGEWGLSRRAAASFSSFNYVRHEIMDNWPFTFFLQERTYCTHDLCFIDGFSCKIRYANRFLSSVKSWHSKLLWNWYPFDCTYVIFLQKEKQIWLNWKQSNFIKIYFSSCQLHKYRFQIMHTLQISEKINSR